MRSKLAAVFALLITCGLLSGCVFDPDWGWGHHGDHHGEHHDDHHDHY